ncbi:MAG: 16S rRNA (adenine(1518)-N(6)/adenine(1519)-N(6))-dimethyltransferase RsmA [Clostridiales bacterium]|jgi:16S rRNA (adenine1518-N6/adenine1519-N6)-dimethyltransferase|nr:16S rRNA (adenine(1518)-N(6)/adenine(1519)-N(6))-dimethyltransferase RsmA [Clostridiales bacterium]
MDFKAFRFDKRYGQNFITDVNLLRAIAADAGVTADDLVIEVGAGAGTLTAALCERAGSVVAYEIDRRLESAVAESTARFCNLEMHFTDFMKEKSLPAGKYKVVANLPYYITTPVIFRFVESGNPPESLTVMVQSEVADRITAAPGAEAYGAITANLALRYSASVPRKVGRELFFPRPNVDSAVVRLDRHFKYAEDIADKTVRVIKAAFSMRRKTLSNNLMSALSLTRAIADGAITSCGLSPSVRGETLGAGDFVRLAEALNLFDGSR